MSEGRNRYGPFRMWTEQELQIIKELYPDYNKIQRTLKDALGSERSVKSIRNRASLMVLRPNQPKPWTSDEVEFLKNNYQRLKSTGVAEAIGRTKYAVIAMKHRLDHGQAR